MKTSKLEPEDARLSALLRESRESPSLPPHFRENVWRRIEHGEKPDSLLGGFAWLEGLAARLLRPRFALACLSALLVAGALLGVAQGANLAKQEAQARYLAAVAPNPLH